MDREQTEKDQGTEASGKTRRAILLGGAAGLAGLAASAMAKAPRADAASGDYLVLGEFNTANVTTELAVSTSEIGSYALFLSNSEGPAFSASGTTYGVCGTDLGMYTCVGVAAFLTNPSNASPAIAAETLGTSSAVQATIDNSANASAAVSATTNGTGPAIEGSDGDAGTGSGLVANLT
ncbi:MAG: hypothetical protein ABSD78_18015, partial [Acidimicrobiales bacterium]